MSGGEQGNARHVAAERRKHVVELRDAGHTFPEIAQELGISISTAWGHYQKAMRDIPSEAIAKHAATLEQRRAEQLGRIDMEREAAMEVLTARHLTISGGNIVRPITGTDDEGNEVYGEPILDDAPVLAAIATLGKLDDQEARLLGMYAKAQVEQGITWRHEIIGVRLEDIL